MSEATTIDKLSIEITSNSAGASQGIEALAASLAKLKSNGSVGVAVKNLNSLSDALRKLDSVSNNANKLSALADSITKLSGAGSISKAVGQLSKLPGAINGLSSINIDDDLGGKLERVARAVSSLSNVKAGGLSSMVSALSKISEVTAKLDDATINKFADRVKKLNKELEPLSTKMTTIQSGFRGINSSAKSAGNGVKHFGSKVNTTTLNLASLTTAVQGVISMLRPLIQLFSGTISQAIEWEGIAARFGRGFGGQAEEVYSWIQRLNKEMGINVQQFMQYSSVYATMLKGFGVAHEDAGKMALGYTELTYDIWAGYNDVYKTFDEAAEAVKSAIAGEVEPVRRAGFTIVESTLEQTAANHGLEISLEKATEAQKSYLRYLTLVDQAHTQGLVGTYAKELNTAEGMMRTFSQQLKSLAQAFGSLFLPVLVKVMPWLQAFVNLLTDAIQKTASFFGIEIQPVKWGSQDEGMGELTKSADTATDAVANTTDAVKDLKKATLGIDELNVISPPTENKGAGGAGSDLSAFEGLGVDSLWDESIFDQIQMDVDKIKDILKEALTSISAVVAGFMLAIGTILVVSGANIPLGLAMMAAGAATLVGIIAQNWNGMSDQLAKTLTTVTAVLGGFLLAIGALLTFSGVNVGLGIALMVAGAVSLGTAATINWKFLNGDMENGLSILTGIVSGALLAVGALFALTGVATGLGIALMVAGAVGLATTVGLNWDAMSEPMRKAIGTLEMIVGSALLAFGAILAFTGANIPLGIGMIAAGVISMVAAVQLNWDSLNGDMKNRIATLTALVSGALLGIGAILAFTGVATGIGIAMIALGAVGLVASATTNWGYITEQVKAVLKEIGIAVGAALLALGILLVCTGVGVPIGIALIALGAVSLVTGIALNWDSIVTSIKETLKKIGIAAGAAMLAIGLILCLTGVGIPLGIALIAAGAASLVTGIALNWDSILNGMKTAWGKIEKWWNGLKELKPVEVAVGLLKKGWSTISGWIGKIPTLSQAIKLYKSGWNTVKNWIGSIPAVSQAIKLYKSGWSTVKGWIGNIPVLGASIKLVKNGWSTVKKWLGSLNFDIGFKLPKIGVNWGSKTIAGFKISYPTGFYTYAKGGFPDMGELFIAREAGPEMVGKIGSKTTVANNQQIVDAVSEGVYTAVVSAMKQSEGNGGQAFNIYLDGRQLTSVVEKRQRERGATIMRNGVYAY